MKSRLFGLGDSSSNKRWARSRAQRISQASGREHSVRSGELLEALEGRVLLAGDHPSLPNPFNPSVGTVITLQTAPGTKADGRGAVAGNLGTASDDDTFRFTMPGAMGTSDFVSVLVDTLLAPDNMTPLGSTLDSYVEVYNSSGQIIATGANNSILSSTRPGVATDGWAGFIGQAGETYTIRVRSEQGAVAAGKTRFGNYTLRVDAAQQVIAIDATFDPSANKTNDLFGNGAQAGQISFLQDEAVYRVTVPNDPNFLSLATAGAIAEDFTLLDTHLSVYDSQGNLVVEDEQAGRLTNAFSTFASQPGATFFFRVRSDELAAASPSTGDFTLVLDMGALSLALDPVTRVNATRTDAVVGPTMNTPGTGSKLYQFRPEGNGLAFITIRQSAAPSLMLGALPDPALRIYNDNGVQIAFNDDFAGSLDSQIAVVLQGGETYFLIVEGFDRAANGGFTINIEAQHTFGPTVPVDDHVNETPIGLINYEGATPVIFNAPFQYTDFDGNVADATWKQQGVTRGRLHNAGDTDLFQFVPPLNQQDTYAGDDGNEGRALYVGGNYGTASYNGSASGPHTLDTETVSIWDAGRFNHAGPEAGLPGSIIGDIFALTEWDLDGGGANLPFLIAGGDFGIVDPMGNIVPTNLAIRVFNAFNPLNPGSPSWTWVPLAETNGPVFALAVGDLIPVDAQGSEGPELYIGGRFTNIGGGAAGNIAGLAFNGANLAFLNMGAGVTGGAAPEVRALAIFDPAQAVDPDADGPLVQPPDQPAGLYIGGRFSAAPGVAGSPNNIVRWGFNPTTAVPAPLGNTYQALGQRQNNQGVLGVNAADTVLSISSLPVVPAGGTEAVNTLFVGGLRGPAGGFLRSWNAATPFAMNSFSADLGYGGTGAVRAMQQWVFPASAGLGTNPFLLLAGGNDANGFVRFSDGLAFGGLTTGDSAVHSLHTFADVEPGFVSDSSVLYIGGSFTQIVTFAGDPLPANRIAKLDFDREGDWARIGSGVDELRMGANPAAFPTVFALASFNDNIGGGFPVAGQPVVYDRSERGSSRVHLRVTPNAEAFIGDITVTVYDSNLNIVYALNNTLSTMQNTAQAGAFDPARQDQGFLNVAPELAFVNQFTFDVWGGEVYYIAVGGTGTGRYSVEVITDALPPEANDNGDGSYAGFVDRVIETPDGTIPTAMNNTNVVALDPLRASRAPELSVDASGRTRTFQDPTNQQNPAAYHVRAFDTNAAGISRVVFTDLPALQRVNDSDLFKFRAPSSGMAEIRLSTSGIISGYQEIINIPGMNPTQTVRQKQFNSPLDGALRVFNNDFEQISYNDDNYGVQGFEQNSQVNQATGDAFNLPNRFYRHRDPSVVIPVETGETYFIQIESGQLNTWLRDPTLVDWRHAIGAYEVFIRTTPSLNGIDDHSNNPFDATPIAINASTGNGSVSGDLRDVSTGVFQNPNDNDFFRYSAPNRGQTFVRVVPLSGTQGLRPAITVLDATTGGVVATLGAGPNQTAQLSIFPEQGDEFLILVDGDAGSQGGYRLEIDGPGIADDHASERNWRGATPLALVPFFGTATATGVIENPNDQDLFRFTAETYETATVRVTSLDTTLDPFVQVFEISSDRNDSTMGNPNFLQVSFNDNDGNSNNSFASFATTPGRTYYVLVSGVNLNLDRGRYQVQVTVAPTDDHPNFTDFQSSGLATTIALAFNALSQTGVGTAAGNIEKTTDDDMFRFTAPANGEAKVTIETPDSGLVPRVNIFDSNGNLLGTGAPMGDMAMVMFTGLVQNQQYFIQVLPNDTMANATGTYTVGVMTSPVDDHADAGEFGAATVITLSASNGLGASQGIIVPETDTDLFRFSTLAPGATTVRVTTTGSTFAPRIRIFNSAFAEIFVTPGNGDVAQQAFGAGAAGETYFVLVERNAGSAGATAVGQYQISVQGQIPGGGGPGPNPIDDHADAGEFNAATPIALNAVNGRGNGTGVINFIGDTDLFRFTPSASGNASVQVNVPAGGLVDGQVRIFNQSFNEIASDFNGFPGATAAVSFGAVGGQVYYILVEPNGFSTGSYNVRIDSQPLQFVQYYPEGFASRRVDEFVPLVNPNNFPVEYALYARYERGANNDVPIWTGIVQPNSRSGVTITTRQNFEGALVRRNEPYALELRSSALLGATFSHYDFNVSIGENFTRETSTQWTFANFNKNSAEFRDFLLLYNPSDSAQANVKITLYYENGFTTTFEQTVDALRRSGINFNTDGRAPQQGRFGIKIESDAPIVASQSSYNLLNSGGDGLLGDTNGGSTVGVIAGISTGGASNGRIAFLNTSDQPATITVTASYSRVDLPDLVRIITVPAGSVNSQTLEALGLTADEVAGLRYTSNVPVTVSVLQYQNGDGDSTQAATFAATQFLWGDAFNNPRRAGITYLEDLSLYNPTGTGVDVTITFLFNNGTTQQMIVNVGAGDFAFVNIDQSPIILNLANTTPYSLRVTAATPFVGVFTRYDRFLNGGWSALGSPVGLTNPLDSIV